MRGDLLPNEYVYVDYQDLASKIRQLLEQNTKSIFQMGLENKKWVISLAKKQEEKTLETIKM